MVSFKKVESMKSNIVPAAAPYELPDCFPQVLSVGGINGGSSRMPIKGTFEMSALERGMWEIFLAKVK